MRRNTKYGAKKMEKERDDGKCNEGEKKEVRLKKKTDRREEAQCSDGTKGVLLEVI